MIFSDNNWDLEAMNQRWSALEGRDRNPNIETYYKYFEPEGEWSGKKDRTIDGETVVFLLLYVQEVLTHFI